jgi:hypothetical protein
MAIEAEKAASTAVAREGRRGLTRGAAAFSKGADAATGCWHGRVLQLTIASLCLHSEHAPAAAIACRLFRYEIHIHIHIHMQMRQLIEFEPALTTLACRVSSSGCLLRSTLSKRASPCCAGICVQRSNRAAGRLGVWLEQEPAILSRSLSQPSLSYVLPRRRSSQTTRTRRAGVDRAAFCSSSAGGGRAGGCFARALAIMTRSGRRRGEWREAKPIKGRHSGRV